MTDYTAETIQSLRNAYLHACKVMPRWRSFYLSWSNGTWLIRVWIWVEIHVACCLCWLSWKKSWYLCYCCCSYDWKLVAVEISWRDFDLESSCQSLDDFMPMRKGQMMNYARWSEILNAFSSTKRKEESEILLAKFWRKNKKRRRGTERWESQETMPMKRTMAMAMTTRMATTMKGERERKNDEKIEREKRRRWRRWRRWWRRSKRWTSKETSINENFRVTTYARGRGKRKRKRRLWGGNRGRGGGIYDEDEKAQVKYENVLSSFNFSYLWIHWILYPDIHG